MNLNLAYAAFRGSIRHSLDQDHIEEILDGLLVVDKNGKILACAPAEGILSRLPQECLVHDFRSHWILPGFVDCHVHLPQLDCRNKMGFTLLDWLKNYIFPAEAKFLNAEVYRDVAPRFFNELLSHGITTASIYSTIHQEATDFAFQTAEKIGLRAIIGQVLMDQNAPPELLRSPLQLLRESEQLIKKWHGKNNKLFFSVTPRFALSCSKELLRDAGKLAREAGTYFQTHLAETTGEVTEAKRMHDFSSYAAFYESIGCAEKTSLFAHSIYLEDDDWNILSDHHCKLAHCPTSNIFLKSGTMPLQKVEEYGITYGLGTDVGAGPTFSMSEVMQCAESVHTGGRMTSEKSFYAATLGGAEVLLLADQIGNFTRGKFADFSVFSDKQASQTAQQVFVEGKSVWKRS